MEVIVWLDNDNDVVLKKADQIYQYINLCGFKGRKITKYKEPKWCTDNQIKDVLEGK